jgi:hypothetical protein
MARRAELAHAGIASVENVELVADTVRLRVQSGTYAPNGDEKVFLLLCQSPR